MPYASAPRPELVALYGWVRHVSDARIALAGLGISYPLFGADLSNHVQYVGHKGPHGAFDRVEELPGMATASSTTGNYDFVVVSANTRGASEPVEARWTALGSRRGAGAPRRHRVRVPRSGAFGTGGCG